VNRTPVLRHNLLDAVRRAQQNAALVLDDERPGHALQPAIQRGDIRWSRPLEGAELQLAGLRVHALARWARGGLPIIRLSAGLAASFCLTDFDAAETADVRWPFPTMLVEIVGGSPLMIDVNGRPEPARQLWLHGFRNDGPGEDGGRRGEFICLEREEGEGVCLHELLAPIGEIGPSAWLAVMPALTDAPTSGGPLTHTDHRNLVNAKRVLVGLALYLREKALGRPIIAHARTKSERRAAGAGGLPAVWEIGREVPLVQSLVDAARARGERDRAKWHLCKRFVVRGHWRRQAVGVGRAERRLIFVAPFWKGPRDGTGIAHLYNSEEA